MSEVVDALPEMPGVRVLPLNPERWSDLETLFGEHGADNGCWCMWWRETAQEFAARAGEGNRLAMSALVASGRIPGLLAYSKGEPVGWVSVGPRSDYPRLERSPTLGRLDGRGVWSVVCYFVAKAWRGRGVALELMRAAVDYARASGAKVLEAYPVDTGGERLRPGQVYMGVRSAYQRLGFVEIVRPSPSRAIMRLLLARED